MSYAEENKKTLERFIETIGKKNVIDSKVPKEKRYYVTIKTEKLRDAVTYIKEKEGLFHLSTITGVDYGEERELNYHFNRPNLIFTIKVRVPADKPVVPSITDIINGATIFEREVYDLLGVTPEGHPNPKRLLMTEEWPEGVFPLLKKWDVKSLRKAIDGEEWT
ncbi:MAG: NADH-quinone oxidoreductase subunit C [Candidatus Bathyarchaeota archaeon]|nr:NADH-quinone oxidoreductase subunit C [Candidatus Bathyarchaeota archaeon]